VIQSSVISLWLIQIKIPVSTSASRKGKTGNKINNIRLLKRKDY